MMLCKLTQKSVLRIEGPDAEKFLQGQTTCDFKALTPDIARPGAHCTAKGRVVSDFLACRLTTDCFLLRCHESVEPLLSASLNKYIVFSKAKLNPQPVDVVGLISGDIDTVLASIGIDLPAPFAASHSDAGSFIRLNDQMVECWLSEAQSASLQAQLATTLNQSDDAWQLGMIRHGLGEVTASTSGEWIPQMLNLQVPELSGISFTKGCYTGQEIVARMQYRGKLKRHMYRFSTDQLLTPGTALYATEGGQSIGEVVICAQSPEGIECLAVATEEAVEQETIFAAISPTTPLKRLSLPYSYPAQG